VIKNVKVNKDKEVEEQTGINRRTFRRYRMKYGVTNESRKKIKKDDSDV